jgi:hypothetical protein
MKKTVQILMCIILFTSCATIFIPRKQKITINTGQESAVVYIDKEEFGTGSVVKGKVNKNKAQKIQVIIKTKDYKDEYYALVKTHRPTAFWPLQVLNLPFIWMYGGGNIIDFGNIKNWSFNKVNDFPVKYKIQNRKESEKYIYLTNIKLSINDKSKDIRFMNVKYDAINLDEQIKRAERDKDDDIKKAEMEALKTKSKKKGKSLDEDKNKEVKYDDIKYTENVYKTLKITGFIDTVNRVFRDNNNTLVLEGNIKKINVYRISKKKTYLETYTKCKLFTTWYVKNTYNEVLDSIDSEDYSGDFTLDKVYSNAYTYSYDYEIMYNDAVDVSYYKLLKNPKFVKYLKQETDFTIKDPILNLQKPTSTVLEKTDASPASVIIKRKDGQGHGSGFAITNDGYIITNYHVIADKFPGKTAELKVVTNEGEELEATVIRVNKFNDLALLKVTKSFDKAFTVSSEKTFKNMQDVYTIGAPKSVELGQSVSSGVISNERKNNNNSLLQLGMSVNAGNSGGPLFDANGTLHGVIVSKLIGQNTEGVSFAIPGYLMEKYLKLKIN